MWYTFVSMTKRQTLARKEKALNRFINEIRGTKEGEWVDNIVVHGSFVTGEVEKDSDIDILVFAKNPKQVERKVDDIAMEIMLNEGEYIESFVYPSKEYKTPSSYFVYHAIKTGSEVALHG